MKREGTEPTRYENLYHSSIRAPACSTKKQQVRARESQVPSSKRSSVPQPPNRCILHATRSIDPFVARQDPGPLRSEPQHRPSPQRVCKPRLPGPREPPRPQHGEVPTGWERRGGWRIARLVYSKKERNGGAIYCKLLASLRSCRPPSACNTSTC